jgi:gas vesicle protein
MQKIVGWRIIAMSTKTKNNGLLQGLIIGGAVGTISALLCAPRASKLRGNIIRFLKTNPTPKQQPPASVKQTINSMAQNEDEMAKLGEEMKNMETNTQVAESGMIPDPIQYEK